MGMLPLWKSGEEVVVDVSRMIRPAVDSMKPYQPILPLDVLSEQLGHPPEMLVKLDANENPYGPPPSVLNALRNLQQELPIYPDPESRRLRAGLASYLGVDISYILAGAGADELIDLICRLFLDPGDRIVNCPPTFGMYPFGASLAGAHVIDVWREADFGLDVNGVEKAVRENGTKLLFITSPNNPDGSVIPPEQLARLLALPVIIVLDEAYLEFSGMQSVSSQVPKTPNLIVLRTFSKWAGIAGLRVGYGIFPLEVIEHLWKIKQPYNLSVAGQAAALAALDDHVVLTERAERICRERERLADALAEIPFLEPYPSRANFILCRVIGRDAAELKRYLAEEHGILIRYFDKPGLTDHVRITVGKPEHTEKLLSALHTLSATAS